MNSSKSPGRLQSIKTRATDDFSAATSDFIEIKEDQGYIVKYLVDCKNAIPERIYNRFMRYMENYDGDPWEDTEMCWQNSTFVVIYKTPETIYPPKPFLATEWDQVLPYNLTQYSALGCVTIAVAQIMKFHEYPFEFNWKAMPNKEANYYLTDFLGNLREQLRVNSDGSCANENAISYLRKQGYICKFEDHDIAKLIGELNYYRRPVYAYGANSQNTSAHAWVIDGYISTEKWEKYTLYHLNRREYPDFEYEPAEGLDTETILIQNGSMLFHMNWGWGGRHNGWYGESSYIYRVGDYGSRRKNMYIRY